jgi:D-threo-aldose 1-dehydrogenase
LTWFGDDRGLSQEQVGQMERRTVGRTSLEVTVLGFGGNALGNLYAEIDEAEARDAVRAAYESGVRYFDTAPMYGHGLSERRIGDALRSLPRDEIVVSTKVGRLLVPYGRRPPPRPSVRQGGIFTAELPFLPTFDFSYDATMRSFEDSLQRLGMSRVDILLIHDCDEWSHGPRYEEILRSVEHGALPALMRLKDAGVIGAIGAGVNQAEACERLMDIGTFDCFMLAGRYTLLEQSGAMSFLSRAAAAGISVLLAAPYNTGILVSGSTPDARYDYKPATPRVLARVHLIEEACRAHGVPLPAAALQFVLAHPAVATVVPGSRSRAEAVQNAEWASMPIAPGLWRDLKAARLLREDVPVPDA